MDVDLAVPGEVPRAWVGIGTRPEPEQQQQEIHDADEPVAVEIRRTVPLARSPRVQQEEEVGDVDEPVAVEVAGAVFGTLREEVADDSSAYIILPPPLAPKMIL